MPEPEIVPTINGYGWTSTIPNQITCEWLNFLSAKREHLLRALDIGAGFGVAILPALKTGAHVIANDLEVSHLEAIRKEATRNNCAQRLELVRGRFPNELSFGDLNAIHCSNVLHFLSGVEIVSGAEAMFRWLRPGGRIYIQVGTIYAGHIKALLPIFEMRRRRGIHWAGEVDGARSFVIPQFRDATPNFMNYLDGPPLVSAFEKAGFQILRSWYYTRTDLPRIFRNDGREHLGLICMRPT